MTTRETYLRKMAAKMQAQEPIGTWGPRRGPSKHSVWSCLEGGHRRTATEIARFLRTPISAIIEYLHELREEGRVEYDNSGWKRLDGHTALSKDGESQKG